MPDAKGPHNVIAAYAMIAIGNRLDRRNCIMFASQMRVRIDSAKYVYPDLSVVCGRPRYEDASQLGLLNPTLVVEVTSPSSMVTDHHDKLHMYGSVPSIQGYLILDQERIFADWYTRDGAGWHLRQYSHSADVIPLAPLDIELPLAEVYSRVELPG